MAYSGHINSDNYTVGMAYIFLHPTTGSTGLASIDAQIGSAAYHTHFCVGNTVNAEIAPDVTYLDHFISINGERRKDKTVVTTKSISVTFTFDEINATNVKRFLYGFESTAASPTFIVNASPTKEFSAQIYFTTQVGRDFIYKIPRAALKSDGNLAFDPEDLMNANMMLDVLYDSTYTQGSPTAYDAPYGYNKMPLYLEMSTAKWVNSGKPKSDYRYGNPEPSQEYTLGRCRDYWGGLALLMTSLSAHHPSGMMI